VSTTVPGTRRTASLYGAGNVSSRSWGNLRTPIREARFYLLATRVAEGLIVDMQTHEQCGSGGD
jgi:hypothetical protein